MMNRVVRAVFAAAVVVGCCSASADIPASAYVQTGLVAQWDGIDNAGTGTHQADATAWKDISTAAKGGDLTLAAKEAFGDNCLTITTAGTHVTGDLGLSSMTLEFVLKRTSGSTGIRRWDDPVGTTSFESWSTDNEGLLERIGSTRQLTVKPVNGTMYTLATRYTNGGEHRFQAAANGAITKGKTTNNATVIGNYNIPSTIQLLKNTANLEVYAVRIYDRELTDDELMRNAALDRMRFEDATMDETGYRYNADESRVEVCVSVDMIGADTSRVRVNEGEAGTTAVAWANLGDTVAMSVLPGADETFVCWKSADIDLGGAAT